MTDDLRSAAIDNRQVTGVAAGKGRKALEVDLEPEQETLRQLGGYVMNTLRITALIVLGMLVGCSGSPTETEDVEKQAFDDMRSEVREIIDDSGREAAVVALVDDMEAQYFELREAAKRRRSALQELSADYDATREQFAEYLDTHNANLQRTQQAFLASHRSLINATTAEEWSALEKANTKSMQQLAESIASI